MKDKHIQFLKEFNYLAPTDLEDVLEYLEDNNLLTKDGKKFKNEFWKTFIADEHFTGTAK